MPNIHIRNTLNELSHTLAKRFIQLAHDAITQQGSFHVGLTGGKTPQIFYDMLSKPPYSNQLPWEHIHIYICDERFVPATHNDSNYGMIKKLLLDHVSIPLSHVHHIQTEDITPEISAAMYTEQLMMHLPKRFDFILLGIGEDGHVASLFPGTNILYETNKMAAAVYVKKLSSWRISLTFPVLNLAKNIAFLVIGKSKSVVLKQVFTNTSTLPCYPLEMLSPKGQVEWYLENETAMNILYEQEVI